MKMYNILDYGVRDDEETIFTKEIQEAFNAASEEGGTVLIPAGQYMTGAINMGSASLHLEKGARLLASGNIADYSPIGYNHNEWGDIRSFLYSMYTEGVCISGEGTIDLNGDAFFNFQERNVPAGNIPFTDEQVKECTATYTQRPEQPIFFYECEHVTVRDITIVNAPSWTLTFVESSDIRVLDVTIDNSLILPNNDGMHISSCEDVIVRGCNISSGDDCIAITATTNWEVPCQRIVVSDCVLRSCSKAIVIGYVHSIVRDVTISNCVIYESNRAFAIMATPEAGLIENVVVSNMRLDTRIRAGNWWGNGEPICIMGVPHHVPNYRDAIPQRNFGAAIRNIYFQNIICTGENAIGIIGHNESVQNIRINGLHMELKESKNLPLRGRMIDLAPGEQTGALPDDGKPYWLMVKEARNVTIKNATILPFNGVQPFVHLDNCSEFDSTC